MEQTYEHRYCEKCNEETLHIVREDALSIDYQCENCNAKQEIIKNFF